MFPQRTVHCYGVPGRHPNKLPKDGFLRIARILDAALLAAPAL